MLLSTHPDGPRPKAIVSISQLPNYINVDQPPSKTEPFRTVAEHHFSSSVSLLVSDNDTSEALQDILQHNGTLCYCKMFMKLTDIVSGEFFNDYIKSNNIAMISEGRPGLDDIYTLRDGTLRIEVNKPVFERLGLEGKAIPSKGRKHVKARYAVELDLRSPSMVRGRKGFERVLRAFSEVLNESKAWLFYNVKTPADFSGPVATFQPIVKTIAPTMDLISGVGRLDIQDMPHDAADDVLLDLLEWISMAMLGSPRLRTDDNINSYLSRYQRPPMVNTGSDDHNQAANIHRIQWQGFLHSDFIMSLVIAAFKKLPKEGWLAMTVHDFDDQAYTIIKTQKEVLVSRFCD